VNLSDEEKHQRTSQFMEITHSNDQNQAEQMLEWHNWAVDRAVNAFIIGDLTEPASYSRNLSNQRSLNINRTVDTNSEIDGRFNSRIIQRGNGPSAFSTIIGFPFWIIGKTISFMLRPISYFLIGGSVPKDCECAAESFILQFESAICKKNQNIFVPKFLRMSYKQAISKCFNEKKFLMVYLHSPLHEDTPSFCSVLSSQGINDFLSNCEMIEIWGGSVWHGEAYSASISLKANRFPQTVLLLCNSPNQVQVMERFDGNVSLDAIIERSNIALAQFQVQMENARRVQREREQTRQLLNEQDAEYRAALEADRLVQQQKEREILIEKRAKEEEQRKAEEEITKQKERENYKKNRLAYLEENVGEEPRLGAGTTRIRLQLPSGAKLDRKFLKEETLESVAEFLELYLLRINSEIQRFGFSTNYPKRNFSKEEYDLSLSEAGLHPQSVLLVIDLDA